LTCPQPLAIAKALTLYLGNEIRTSQIRSYLRVIRSGYSDCDMDREAQLIAEELEALGVTVIDDLSGEIKKFADGISVILRDDKVLIRRGDADMKITRDHNVIARIYELISEAKSGSDFVSLVESLERSEEELSWLKEYVRKLKEERGKTG
jgi:hypothetical protein